jgi:hypothetical protein
MELLKCLPKNDSKIVFVEKKKTYTQKKLDVKEYKADYYVKNIEIYAERNRKYREKQKAIKDGTYVKSIIIEENTKIVKNITVNFI